MCRGSVLKMWRGGGGGLVRGDGGWWNKNGGNGCGCLERREKE